MPPAIQIRPFSEHDRPALRRLFHASRRDTFTWLSPSTFAPADFDRDTEGETILVADPGLPPGVHEPYGFVSWWPPENFIHLLFVAPGRTGLGIGARLLSTALAQMGRPARLKVMQPNRRARLFYQREGWSVLAEGASEDGPYFLMGYDGA